MQGKDYYEILGVGRNATPQQIKAAYRKLAFEYHPDRNKGDAAAEMMKQVNESYAALSDPEKRTQYDVLYHQFGSSAHGRFRQDYTEQDIFRGSDIHQIFEEISRAFGFRGFDEVFNEFYGPGYRTFEFQRPGLFGRGFIYAGSSRRKYAERQRFPLSGNLYRLLNYGLRKRLGVELPERGRDRGDTITISPALARTGGKIRYLYRIKSKELFVKIPPGIKAGQRIRLRGMGDKGKGGGEPGDLYLKVRVRRPLLQRIKEFLRQFFLK